MSGQLVEQWTESTLGELFEIVTGTTPSKSKTEFYGDYMPFIKPPELLGGLVEESADGLSELGSNQARVLPPESVLVSCIGNLGKLGMNSSPVAFNQQINAIKPNYEIANPKFVFYYCMSNQFRDQLHGLASGTTVFMVNKTKFKGIKISLPSLNEQQRIVNILDEAFRNIELKQVSVEQNLEQSEVLIQSIFDSMFENADWESSTFDEIATIKGGKRLPKGHTYSNNKTAHPYISVKDFTSDGTIDTTNLKYIDEETFNQISRYTISSNDLYLSIAGTIGKTGIVPVEIDGANLTENACKLIFNEGYDAKFVYYFTKTTSFLNQAGLLTKATGQPKLALTRLKQIVIRSPDSLEQERLVKRLDEIVHQSKLVEGKLSQELHDLDELKQSILQEAFNGTL